MSAPSPALTPKEPIYYFADTTRLITKGWWMAGNIWFFGEQSMRDFFGDSVELVPAPSWMKCPKYSPPPVKEEDEF